MALEQTQLKEVMQYIADDQRRRTEIAVAREYYYIDNPILRRGILLDTKDLLRKADNRIAHNFHQLITDEEVDYILSYDPIIDVGDADKNKKIFEFLGDDFLKKSRALAIEACNAGVAWLHYWIDVKESKLCYAVVPTDQIIAVMEDSLEEKIRYLIRYYPVVREIGLTKKTYLRVEVWDDTKCEYTIFPGDRDSFSLGSAKDDGTLRHAFGKVPFISFANNNRKQSNLRKYKGLIDAYDIVVSGYVNDVMDIQQVIYILENYAGTNLSDFLNDLKKYKTVSVGDDGVEGSSGDLRTLAIDIPVEARNSLLEFLKKQIYTAGQALSRDVESVGNASGETLKFFYRDLDLKVGDKEVEFISGYRELVRVICDYKGININGPIGFTFTRNKISNDQETAQICKDSVGVIPLKLIWKNHPFVDNLEECEEMWDEEKQEESEYSRDFSPGNYKDPSEEEDE